MDKSFDELFDEFFNPRSKIDGFKNNGINHDFFENMLTSSNVIKFSNDEGEEIVNKLGEPDEIYYYSDDGKYIEERIWHTEKGDFVRKLVTDDPKIFGENNFFTNPFQIKTETQKSEKPLEVQLEEALEKEDYEKAAEIRDLINPPKKKRGRPKKIQK